MPLTIEIDEPDPYRKFNGGELIHGRVVVINKSGKSKLLSQDLVIKFEGRADSHWKEQRKNVSHERQYLITTYDEEVYFTEHIVLKNNDSSIHNRDIRPGRTEYSFTFQLPMGLPETYKSSHGSVTYFAEVPYPKPWKMDYAIRKDFEVAGHLDLNCNLDFCNPGQFAMEKKFWFGMGKVSTKLYLPRRGYVPGEMVDFSLEVINESRFYLKKIRVYFCQVTAYYAKTSEFHGGRRLHKIKCKPVHPKGTATIEGSIPVPDVPPTELGGCRLIQPQYGIMIKVIAATFGKLLKSAVLEGRVPILIGTTAVGYVPPTMTFIRSTNEIPVGPDIKYGSMLPKAFFVEEAERVGAVQFANLCPNDPPVSSEKPPSYDVATSLNQTPIASRVKSSGNVSNDADKKSVYAPDDASVDAETLNKVLWQVANHQHAK